MWKISFVMLVTTAFAGLLIYNPYELSSTSTFTPIDISSGPAIGNPPFGQVETVPAAGPASTVRPQDVEVIVRKVLSAVGALPDKPVTTGASRPLPPSGGFEERPELQGATESTAVQLGPRRRKDPTVSGIDEAVKPASVPHELTCERDEKRLARLRASPSRDEVIRFERELACERLRPQLVRLRESVVAQRERSERDFASHPSGQSLTADAQPQTPESEVGEEVARPLISQDQACKRDADTLTRLRASQVRDEVIRFERELACEKLRRQVVRLRESIDAN